MITSCPRESRSVPSVSGASMAWPPGLSVIDSTSMRASSASVRAFSTSARLRSAVTTPRAVTSSTAIENEPGTFRHSRNGVDVKLEPLPPE